MTGTVYTCLHTNQSRSCLNHLVLIIAPYFILFILVTLCLTRISLLNGHLSCAVQMHVEFLPENLQRRDQMGHVVVR